MTTFMDKDFLLNTETARKLYHDYAASCPIIDYHCHISPKEIWEDQRFENITKVWLGGDHYKWRLMRCAGVDEYYITGGASDYEKFCKWAEVVGKAIGNPLYHWTHLELQRFFGYHGTLSAKTADEVWNLANETLQKPGYRGIPLPRPDREIRREGHLHHRRPGGYAGVSPEAAGGQVLQDERAARMAP